MTPGPKLTAKNRLVEIYLTVPDLQIKPAVGIGTHPCLVVNRCTLASEVRQRNEITFVALQALGERRILQGIHLPNLIYLKYISGPFRPQADFESQSGFDDESKE